MTSPQRPQTTKKTRDRGLTCPFCLEDDFDKEGLLYHIDNYCSEARQVQYEAALKRGESFRMLGKSCPKCGKPMIENRRYIECGEMHCDYIEEIKK